MPAAVPGSTSEANRAKISNRAPAYRLAPFDCLHLWLGINVLDPSCATRTSTMSKAQTTATLSNMIDIDMEDDTLAAPAATAAHSNQENVAPVIKKRGRKATAKRFSKPPKKRINASSTVTAAANAGLTRVPLKEAANPPGAEEADTMNDSIVQTEGDGIVERKGKSKAHGKTSRSTVEKCDKISKQSPSRTSLEKRKDGEFEYTPKVARTTKAPIAIKNKHSIATEGKHGKVIPESQIALQDEMSEFPQEGPIDSQRLPQSTFISRNQLRPDIRNRQRRPRSRTGSVSDTERASSDHAVRRRLGDATRKLDNLTLKYNHLRDVGIKEAESNFERLKTQAEARSKGRPPHHSTK